MNKKLKYIIDTEKIPKSIILSHIKYLAESWGENSINSYDEEYDISGSDLADRFWGYLEDIKLETFEEMIQDEIDQELYSILTDDDLLEAIEYLIDTKYYDEINNVVYEIMDSFADDIKEMLDEPDPNNYPWGPGMSQKDFM